MTFLEKLLEEISETKVNQTGPEDLSIGPGEKVLGKASVEIQKIETLLTLTTDTYNTLLENQDYETNQRIFNELELKMELLNNMMWMAINSQFDSWGIDRIGIRNDWLVVDATDQRRKIPYSSQKISVRTIVDSFLDKQDNSQAIFSDNPNEYIH